jgi:hypothetical protein
MFGKGWHVALPREGYTTVLKAYDAAPQRTK